MKKGIKFIEWLKHSFEDVNGYADHGRMTGFVCVGLVCFMVLGDKIQNQVQLNAFYALLTFICVLFGIVQIPDLITLVKGYNPNTSKPKTDEEN